MSKYLNFAPISGNLLLRACFGKKAAAHTVLLPVWPYEQPGVGRPELYCGNGSHGLRGADANDEEAIRSCWMSRILRGRLAARERRFSAE
jgi:hypothetical protein